MDTKLLNLDTSLVLNELIIAVGSQDNQTSVTDVTDVGLHLLKCLVLVIVLEEVGILFTELSQDVDESVKGVWQILSVGVELATDCDDPGECLLFNQELVEGLVVTELLQKVEGVKGHVDVVLVLFREGIDKVVDNHGGLVLKDLCHVLLLNSQLRLSLFILVFPRVATIPGDLLALWLDLNLKELDEEHSEGVVLEVLQETVKDLSVLLDQKISEKVVLLLEQKLVHDLEEVSTQDWEWVLIRVEEGGDLIKKRVVSSLDWLNWLLLLISIKLVDLDLAGLVGVASLLALLSVGINILVLAILVDEVVLVS